MNEEKLLHAFDLADEKFIAEADAANAAAVSAKSRTRFLALAACLALVSIISLGMGAYYAVDAIRFNEAVSYLTEQGYSVVGLTKPEIMEIYNSINTHSASSELPVSNGHTSTFVPQTSSDDASSSVTSENVSSINPHLCQHLKRIVVGKIEPTCSEDGESGASVCADCGYQVAPSHILLATGVHTFENDVCTHCGFVYKIENYIVYELNKSGTGYTVADFKELHVKTPNKPYLDIVIPETYNGLPITAIEDNAFEHIRVGIKSVTLPDTVTYIGKLAFFQSGITHIKLPRDLEYIGENAFGNSSLASIEFNSKLNFIDKSAFAFTKLVTVELPDSVTYIGSNCFEECRSLKELKLSAGLTELPQSFISYAKITKLVIPEGVTSISQSLVSQCSMLEDIYFPSTLEFVSHIAFDGQPLNWYIKRLHITSLEDYMSINFGYGHDILGFNTLLYVDGQPLGFDNTFVYPDSLTGNIDITGACLGRYFNKVVIADGVTEIPEAMFSGWANLTSVEFGKDVTAINYGAFSGCTSLTEITIPDTVEYIGVYAFMGCKNLTDITIPPSVKKIDRAAFRGCKNLKHVYITDMDAFENIEFVYTSNLLQPEEENETSNPLHFGATLYLNGVPVE